MNNGRVAIRYAKALLKFGNERGISERLYSDSLTIIHIFNESDHLLTLLGSPSISVENKLIILKKSFSNSLHPSFFEYLSMITSRGRFEYILNSLLLFRDLYRKENSIIEVRVESATVLSTDELNIVERFIKEKFNKTTELSIILKPELIAGFILIVEGKIMDFSVSGQLLQIKKTLEASYSN